MPSPGRYQSSVFNFLNRRSLQLSEQISRTVRSVKMTAAWGAQILLYPAYVAFQTGRVTAQQLRQAVQTTSLRLKSVEKAIEKVKHVNAPPRPEPTLSSDTPIYKVLQTVEAFALLPTVKTSLELVASSDLSQLQDQTELTGQVIQIDGLTVRQDAAKQSATEQSATEQSAFGDKATKAGIAVSKNGTISGISAVNGNGAISANGTVRSLSSSKIIGIASLLTSRSLVLVTNQSQILDILTTEQQVQLHRRIVWEVAHYWRTRRALWAEQQPAPFPLPLPEVHQNALPPVRVFRRLMAWMQTGSVAIATNLFHESTLVARLQAEQAIAYVHTADSRGTGVDDPWTEDDDTSGFVEMTEFSAELSAAMLNPWERRQQAVLNPSAATPMRLLKNSRFSNLFPLAGRRQNSTQTNRFGRILPDLQSIWSEKRLAQVEDSEAVAAIAPTTLSAETASALQPAQPDPAGQLAPPNSQKGSSDLQTTWIETEATLVGYVKHPLEQILEWLDSGMVWIEEVIARVWNWLRNGRRG